MTLIAIIVFALALGTGAFATWQVVQNRLSTDLVSAAAVAARKASLEIEKGPADTVVLPVNRINRIQVVANDGRVVAASPAMRGMPPITRMRPANGDTRVDGTACEGFSTTERACYITVGFRVAHSVYGDVMVYAAVPEPPSLRTNFLEITLALFSSGLLTLLGWGTWHLAGRTLAPVERIRAEMAEITASDLSRRMPVPASGDEMAQLTTTINSTLERLEHAVENQRRFASDASHELRTPLTGLRTKLELAISDPESENPLETMHSALADAERLQALIEDLLLLARLDAGVRGPPEPIDLAALVTSEVERRSSRHEVLLKLDPGVVVRGSRVQLGRLLANLLANADRHAVSEVRVRVWSERGEAVLEVTDDGLGISAGERERVFQRFTRLDSARSRDAGGTGLGLPIARDIAVAHRGRLYAADSTTGRGARLVLRLPLSAAAPS
ncbi:sensor histidine kinase [Streptosporangium sp. NBC_01469]|uniref:sensor histidine kinase n=1 Tax=Streptosporangium sp. NBC_01469 TaxID=2903898 RepID=UPI002E29B8E5|nr:HAMP domain-containing sensor histidine kinase [Streptosporangium sp. NBC_01469]